jgi:hypothetical protein
MYQCLGNIHIHSTHSDGHASIPAIALAAAKAGLSFIIITDHNTLKGLPEEGCHHGVLVIIGCEINKDSHHYLALNINSEVPINDQDPQQVIDSVNNQGGFGFIAHPPWRTWESSGFAGIEVWNWTSQWRNGTRNVFRALLYSCFHPTGPVKGPCPESLSRFDKQKTRVTAIAGSDAHAWPVRYGPLRRAIFPYSYLFRTVNNCLLLKEPLSPDVHTAKNQIYKALRQGNAFIVNNLAGDAQGFAFTASANGREYQIGDDVPFSELTTLRIKCPTKLRGRLKYRLIHNGRLLDEIPRCDVTVRVYDPGAYRLEVYSSNKPWIFTNPIYIADKNILTT